MDCPAEHQHLNELEEEDLYPDPAEFDMTDPNRKAQFLYKSQQSQSKAETATLSRRKKESLT